MSMNHKDYTPNLRYSKDPVIVEQYSLPVRTLLALENTRKLLLDIVDQDESRNEAYDAMRDVESAIRYVNHYLARFESVGIYTLDFPQNSSRYVQEVASRLGGGKLTLRFVTDRPNGNVTEYVKEFNAGKIVNYVTALTYISLYYEYLDLPLVCKINHFTESKDKAIDHELVLDIIYPETMSGHDGYDATAHVHAEHVSNKYEYLFDIQNQEDSLIGKGFVIKSLIPEVEPIFVPYVDWVNTFLVERLNEMKTPQFGSMAMQYQRLVMEVGNYIANQLNVMPQLLIADHQYPGVFGCFIDITDEQRNNIVNFINEKMQEQPALPYGM